MDNNNLKYIVGAYATAPSLGTENKSLEQRFYDNLIDSIPEMRGLEIPFWGEDIHQFGSEFLLDIIKPDWDNVLSCIPGTMSSLANMPAFGLASDDEYGRAAAIAMHKRANGMLHKMNDYFGKQSIIAVQIATAPSMPVDGVNSSMDSFLTSMNELLSWDWAEAKIVIEHCDSSFPGQPIAKGFFKLENEIKALESLNSEVELGVMINWARSAIEGRSTNTPVEHLTLASKNNVLSGLIFSGVSGNDARYGDWNDTHMPFARSFDVEYYEENSLLTLDSIKQSLNCVDINTLDYLGIKLLSMPIDSSTIERRVGLNRDAISTLNRIVT